MNFFTKAPASPNPLPVPPSIADHRPAFPKALLFLALALLAVAILVFAFLHVRTGNAALPGTLILNIPEPWDAPSGRVHPGAIRYTPSTGEVSRALGPLLDGIAPLAFSNDGTRAFGLLSTLTSYSLVEVRLDTQETTKDYATINAQSAFLSPTWSDDGKYAAFQFVAPSSGTTTNELLSEVRVVMPQEGTTGRTDVAVIDAGVLPVAFSPDNTKILAKSETGLMLIMVTEGTMVPVQGLERSQFGTHSTVYVSEDGRFLVVTDRANTTTETFAFDWSPEGLRSLGSIDRVGQVAFGNDHQFLLFDPVAGEAFVYRLGKDLDSRGKYRLALPTNAQIVGWHNP